MEKKAKKRTVTIILIVIAIISLAVAFYVFQRTQEAYQAQKAYEHWLDGIYGKGRPSNKMILFWAERGAGIAVAVISLAAALCLNVIKPKKMPCNDSGEGKKCPKCNAPVSQEDQFCPECGARLR